MTDIETNIFNKEIMQLVNKVYDNFSTRIDPKSWMKVLGPHCDEISKNQMLCMDIIRFFSENDKIPREVWRVLWQNLKLEFWLVKISHMFSLSYIDEIYRKMYFKPMFDYKLITKTVSGKVADEFIENLNKSYSEISYNEFYKAKIHLQDAKAICENVDTILLESILERCRYNVQKSIELADKALTIDPNKVEAYLNKGIVYMMMGNVEEAYEFFKIAHKINHGNYTVESRLIECCLDLGKYEEARELSGQLLLRYPHVDSVKISYEEANKFIVDKLSDKEQLTESERASLAESYFYMDDIEKAHNIALITEDYLVGSANGCLVFGNILRKLGQNEKALIYYKKALSYGQVDFKAYYFMGQVYKELGDNNNAIKYYEQAIEDNKDFKVSYAPLAKIYMELDRDDNAEKLIDILMYDNFQISYAYSLKGKLFEKQKKADEALIFYSKSIDENQYNLPAYIDKSRILRVLQRYNEANNTCNKALDYGFNDPRLYMEKGKIYEEVEQFEDAIYWFDAIVDSKELLAETLFHRGICNLRLDNKDEADQCFNKAIEIDARYREKVFNIVKGK